MQLMVFPGKYCIDMVMLRQQKEESDDKAGDTESFHTQEGKDLISLIAKMLIFLVIST